MASWLANPANRALMFETADALGVTAEELLTLISYETGGTFDPRQPGPVTKWGQHEGMIQFGQPQQRQHGVDLSSPEAAIRSQLGREGAIVRYALAGGYRPGMGGLDLYSTINAGGPGRYGASDAAAGGAPGTVADKYWKQMGGHRNNARRVLGGEAGVGIGPTRARAAAGLPLRMPEPPAEHDYAGLEDDRDDRLTPEQRARRTRHDRTMTLLGIGQQLLNAA